MAAYKKIIVEYPFRQAQFKCKRANRCNQRFLGFLEISKISLDNTKYCGKFFGIAHI